MTDKWLKLGAESEFSDGAQVVSVGRSRIIVARLEGRLFAFDALCPHAQGPMERAEVDGTIISCPLHAWRFDLKSGGKELHGYRDLPMKKIRVEDDSVYIAVDS